MLSIPAVKGAEIGMGFEAARRHGSEVHDEIEMAPDRVRTGNVRRRTNRAGGLEGGMTTGEPLVVRVAMKPISTLMKPLGTIDTKTPAAAAATAERSDVTAVPAMGVIAEAMAALVLADAFVEKFGGDSLGNSAATTMPTFRTSQPVSKADASRPHLILVGLPGAGKTTVARAVGETLGGRCSISTRRSRGASTRRSPRSSARTGKRTSGSSSARSPRSCGRPAAWCSRPAPAGSPIRAAWNCSGRPRILVYLKVKPEARHARMGPAAAERPLLLRPDPVAELRRLLEAARNHVSAIRSYS